MHRFTKRGDKEKCRRVNIIARKRQNGFLRWLARRRRFTSKWSAEEDQIGLHCKCTQSIRLIRNIYIYIFIISTGMKIRRSRARRTSKCSETSGKPYKRQMRDISAYYNKEGIRVYDTSLRYHMHILLCTSYSKQYGRVVSVCGCRVERYFFFCIVTIHHVDERAAYGALQLARLHSWPEPNTHTHTHTLHVRAFGHKSFKYKSANANSCENTHTHTRVYLCRRG